MSIPDRLGDFRIVEEIGRGGFGVVYRAHQVSLDRPVALKVLYEHRVHTDEEVGRFEREARAAARLDHGAIVSVYAWGEDGGSFFIAQKLVGTGRTCADQLSDLKASGEPPKGYYRQVAETIARVADGLQHAHERGIVHRDIKPSNILLDDEAEPFLGDFGLAKVEDGLELSRTGDFAGSPFYMSPEQADSRRGMVDHRSDIYGLGVTLYELLTLEAPFQGRSSHEIIRKILTEEPRAPTRLAGRVPADLETICLKAMEKSRVRRYQSAEALAHDLRCFLDGEPISASPPSTVSRIWRQARRHRQTVGIVAMGVALVALALIFQTSTNKQQRELQQTELERDIAGQAREATIDELGLQEQLDDALNEGDTDEARQLADRQREWKNLMAQGADLLLDLVPEIEDTETMDAIGDTLQEQFPLIGGAERIKEYLQAHPQAEDEPDPRLTEVSSWLDSATGFLNKLSTEDLGIEVPSDADEGVVAAAESPASEPDLPDPPIADQPEHGAPTFAPPASADGRATSGIKVLRVRVPADPDDGPSNSRDTLRAPYPRIQVLPAGGSPRQHSKRFESVQHLPWYLRFRMVRDGLVLDGEPPSKRTTQG